MPIKFAPRAGPFVFYRQPHHGRGIIAAFWHVVILFTIMPFVWMCQGIWFIGKLAVVTLVRAIRHRQR